MARQGCNLIPVCMELPADTLTPVSAFLRLRQSGSRQSFLLESADGGEDVGRYSSLGIDPFASLRSHSGQLVFSLFDQSEIIEDQASFQKVETFLEKYRSMDVDGLPPFTGGAVGYVSYDAIKYLEDIPIPEGAPGDSELYFMYFRKIVAFDRLKHRLFLITHINCDNDLVEEFNQASKDIEELRRRIFTSVDDEVFNISLQDIASAAPVPAEALLGQEKYCERVKKIKQHIRAGDIFQCVLSDRFQFPFEKDPFLVYRILRMINPSPYLFYLSFGDDEVLLGSSPEMLIRASGGTVETCPIAGTRPRGRDRKDDKKLEQDLLASVKEKAEHLMLVDLGRNDVGRVSKPGTVAVKEFMKVERYSHVMHLVSLVTGKLKKSHSPWQAFGACFPAGTLSGAPKIRAMEIISDLEPAARGPYGGAVVCQNFSGALNSCITIRSLYVKDGVGYVQAGAGVVADSNPKKEYEEVLHKSKAVRTAVAMALKVGADHDRTH